MNDAKTLTSSALLNLPFEIRAQIFRPLALSPLSLPSRANLLPRALVCDGHINPIGYFARGTVTALLTSCRQIHDDVAAILYGENIFVFHFSGLNLDGWSRVNDQAKFQALGFNVFAERYWPLIRRLWIVVGYGTVDWRTGRGDGIFRSLRSLSAGYHYHTTSLRAPRETQCAKHEVAAKLAEDQRIALKVINCVWPEDSTGIMVNVEKKLRFDLIGGQLKRCKGSRKDNGDDEVPWMEWSKEDWPASLSTVWTLTTENDAQQHVRKELRRISWSH